MTHTIRLMLLAIQMGAATCCAAQAQVRVETLSGTGQPGQLTATGRLDSSIGPTGSLFIGTPSM